MIESMSGLGERSGGIVAESENGYLAATFVLEGETGVGGRDGERRVAVDDEARSARVMELDLECERLLGVDCKGRGWSNLR